LNAYTPFRYLYFLYFPYCRYCLGHRQFRKKRKRYTPKAFIGSEPMRKPDNTHRNRGDGECHRRGNREVATVILDDLAWFGGEDAVLVQWARPVPSMQSGDATREENDAQNLHGLLGRSAA